MRPRHDAWSLAPVLAAVALLNCGRFDNAWVWDDLGVFVKSDFLFHLQNAPSLFTHDAMYPADGGAFAKVAGLDTYRPLTLLTFMLDAAWGGRQPWPMHVTGLLLHLCVVAMVFLLARRLLAEEAKRYAWVAALLVGIQPLLGEAHVWINGRADTLSTAFVLASLLLLTGAASATRTLAASALYLCALLSKETALFALPPWLLWEAGVFASEPALRVRLALRRGAPWLAAAALYLGARVLVLGGVRASGGPAHLWLALQRAPYYVLDGLAHLISPARIAPRFMMEEYAAIPSWHFALAWVVGLGLLALVLGLRRRAPLACFGLIWFACTLSPASLISLLKWYGFGRYLYLPITLLAIGLVDAGAAVLRTAPLRPGLKRLSLVAALGYLTLLATLSLRYVNDFRSQASFYDAIMRDYPERSHGYGGAGTLLLEQGAFVPAVALLEHAVELAPQDDRHWNNLAQAHLRAGDPRGALVTARAALQRFPQGAKFQHIVAVASAVDDPEATVAAALAALRLEPTRGDTWALLSSVVTHHPRRDTYVALLRGQLDAPRNAALRSRLLQVLATAGRSE